MFSKTATLAQSKEQLYRHVEDICMLKLAPSLYTRLKGLCEINTKTKVSALLGCTSDHTSFLRLADEMWVEYGEQMTTIRNIFLYLDRSYAMQTPSILPIWDLGLDLLRKYLENHREVLTKVVVGILAAIEADRQGLVVDKDVLKRLVRMLVSCGLYTHRFEVPFIADSKRFFMAEGQALIESNDVADYLVHAEKRLAEATEMTNLYLDISSRPALVLCIESSLLVPHGTALVERGMVGLMDANKLTDLRRLYVLLGRVGVTELIKQTWASYLRKVGESLMEGIDADKNREKSLIDDLLDLQNRAEQMLRQSFCNNESFRVQLRASFEYIVNLKHNKPSELLARYCDVKLREKGTDDAALEATLDKIMGLFKFLQSKDVFEAFYRKMLSKRLLLNKSASVDLERAMTTKLKTECGSNFTSKIEGMFQDIELSRDTMQAYLNHQKSTTEVPSSSTSSSSLYSHYDVKLPDMHMTVLTTGYWPSYQALDQLILPTPLQALVKKFTLFFETKYQGRRLAWAWPLMRCILTARFPKGKKELEVSLLQAVVLCLFNNGVDTLPFKQIKLMTGIEDGELRRTLLSLACGVPGTRTLTKHPKGKDVDDDDTFTYNSDFTNKLFRIKINSIQLKETAQENEKTNDEVFRDRQYQVDAVVVRTMKARKRLSHNELMSELLSQLRFPASAQDIKRRIESLIERDYLERDPDDNSIYNYVA